MRYSIACIITLLIAGQGCSVDKLKKDMQRAESSYAYIKVAGIEATQANSQILVTLYQSTDTGLQMINYRSPAPGVASFFLAPAADYQLYAFEDLNRDFIYQSGEPAAFSADLLLDTEIEERKEEIDYENMPANHLNLSPAMELPLSIDLSTQRLEQQLENGGKSYLKITSWDDPAFAEANVRKGLWQPLTFLEETGFGLYLLEALDPDKQPLLLVHGINGSPTNFRELAENLGDRYQLLLFQYPSGFPLDHTAYILHRAVEDFLERFDQHKLQVLAHSMGGLVSRDMLLRNNAETNAKIDTYITLATPWSGHEAARMGVAWSPAVAPVWKSMVPNSRFLQQLFATSLADNIDHHLFFSYSQKRNGPGSGNDGVVTVKSQLLEQAQREARALYGINDNHNGILSNPCSVATIQLLLSDRQSATQTPLPSCIPSAP